jgi:hypothetical protein
MLLIRRERSQSALPSKDLVGHDIGNLRLRDLAEVAMHAARAVLQGALTLLNGVSEPERASESYRAMEPRLSRPGDDREAPPGEDRDWRHVDSPDRW